ncbi:SIT4 phosphatase-associated protein-domain-containing protein [Sporodiniella umbellata]|nr:SIT4 phosphatase-associated protein-domain-containing protein [Sporodiniella umbellata]
MFWRFGFSNSALDGLLDKADVTLEEVLDEDDLLQEAKSSNLKLIDFLCKPDKIKKLLNYIIADDLEDTQRLKYSFLASEIIACELQSVIDMIVIEQRNELLVPFWSYLDKPAQPRRRASDTNSENNGLNSLQASYFCKTICVLLSKYPVEMMGFIQSNPENLKKILGHLQTSAITDLLLTLVRMEELREGKGVVKWLSENGLLEDLIDRLDPYLDSEEHSIAQQCICEIVRMSQTSLPESPSIGCNELIIQLKSEASMQKLTRFMLDSGPNATSTLVNGVSIIIDIIRHNNADLESDPAANGIYGYSSTIRPTPVSLAEMLNVMSEHIPEFTQLLLKPRSTNGPMRTTLGDIEPLGFERLKICELFAELLHCSNMSNLNHFNEEEPVRELSVGDTLKSQFVKHKAMPICIDLFFTFPWNNFLHYVVYDMLHQVLNGRMDVGLNRQLVLSILKEGQLTGKIVAAQKANDEECAKPKGMRAGYMGHLTFISDEIMKLFEGYPETIVLAVQEDIDMESWSAYCNNELKETKDRDQLPLGGLRPSEDMDMPPTDEEDNVDILDDAPASQYSRFLAQRSMGHTLDDDTEESDFWLNGREDFNGEYEYSGNTIRLNTGVEDDEDDEDEEDDDNEEEYEEGHITPDWTRNFTQLSQPNVLRRIPSHVVNETEEYDEEFDHLADVQEVERRAAFGQREEEEYFGDFESANETTHEITKQMETLDVNRNEDHLVRAVKTREEEEHIKQKKDFQCGVEEQEGEI